MRKAGRKGFPLTLRLLPEHAVRYDKRSKLTVLSREPALGTPGGHDEPRYVVDYDLQILGGGWIGDRAVLPLSKLREWTGWDGTEVQP